MQALVFDHPGEPESVLVLRNISLPTRDANQVLIKVSARTILPADFLFIHGQFANLRQFRSTCLPSLGRRVRCKSVCLKEVLN